MIYTLKDVLGRTVEETKANILTIIAKDRADPRQAEIRAGVDYYGNRTDILNAEHYYFDENGQRHVDETRANNKIRHSFYPLLVKQKVGYLVGKPMNFMAEDAGVNTYLKTHLGEKWNAVVQELLKNASNKGDEWLYCYIDRDGKFDFTICPTEQVIPLWDTAFKTSLDGVIRYFTVTALSGVQTTYIEFWTLDKVTYMEMDAQGGLEVTGEAPHFTINGEGYSFGVLPFVQFKNNEEQSNDLHLIKDLIDAYDRLVSGLQNDLDDIQDTVYVLKGYQGTDPKEFMTNLRYYKLVKVDEDGGVQKLEVHIPIEAKDSQVKRLEDDIYRLGMGVDVSAEKLGNSSGVALKFIYSLLDLKADTAETQFRKGVKHLLKLLSKWYAVETGAEFDRNTIKVTFNRSLIINTKEMIVNVTNSVGLVSPKTLLANHPFVNDVEFELEQMKAAGVTPLWEQSSEDPTSSGVDDSMTGGGYENTGENTTD